jgi:hypothetical protein
VLVKIDPFVAVFNLSDPGRYIHWGFIQISLGNLVVILVMVVVFVAAILVPFRRDEGKDG